jgi:hypothetical protein
MSKFIGVKMIEATPMIAGDAKAKGYKTSNYPDTENGYEVTYPDGYKSWSPASVFEKSYYKLADPVGDTLKEEDIERFIGNIENFKVGSKTTNTTLTCLTGFEVHGQASCVKPENFDLNIGSNYAKIKAEDKIWECLGFVLQWAKYGLKAKVIPPHVSRMIKERDELQAKIVKLNKIINESVAFQMLSDDERYDIVCQSKAMDDYLNYLSKRIKRAGY